MSKYTRPDPRKNSIRDAINGVPSSGNQSDGYCSAKFLENSKIP